MENRGRQTSAKDRWIRKIKFDQVTKGLWNKMTARKEYENWLTFVSLEFYLVLDDLGNGERCADHQLTGPIQAVVFQIEWDLLRFTHVRARSGVSQEEQQVHDAEGHFRVLVGEDVQVLLQEEELGSVARCLVELGVNLLKYCVVDIDQDLWELQLVVVTDGQDRLHEHSVEPEGMLGWGCHRDQSRGNWALTLQVAVRRITLCVRF